MKTIKELNEKIWFRFTKVIYIFLLSITTFIIIFLTSFIIYNEKIENKIIKEPECNDIDIENVQILLDHWVTDKETIRKLVLMKKQEREWVQELEKKDLWLIKWIIIILLLIISELIISYLIFFKLINRIFYYIVLWKFNPKE